MTKAIDFMNEYDNFKKHCPEVHIRKPSNVKRCAIRRKSDGLFLHMWSKAVFQFHHEPRVMPLASCRASMNLMKSTPEVTDLYEDLEIVSVKWVAGEPVAEDQPKGPKPPPGFDVDQNRIAFLSFLAKQPAGGIWTTAKASHETGLAPEIVKDAEMAALKIGLIEIVYRPVDRVADRWSDWTDQLSTFTGMDPSDIECGFRKPVRPNKKWAVL